jgi:DNA-binding PadR family transcriptional regulator
VPPRRATELPSQPEFFILLALAVEDRHGYGIMQEVERRSGGAIRLGPGTLYGAVKRLLAAGWIKKTATRDDDDDDPRRRAYYHLTPAGRAAAGDMARHLADLVATATELGLTTLKPAH